MAKTGFWLRGAKGKLAGATMYKAADGSTQMREVVSPSNPQTEKQMIQRIIMLTVAQAYSKMRSITDHSFEGVKKGQPTMSTFMSQNLDFLRNKVAQAQAEGTDFYDIYSFLKLGEKGFVPNDYQISRGSLPQVICTLTDGDVQRALIAALKTNTYQGVIDSLGLQRGDQLTFIGLHVGADATSPAGVEFSYARVILDPMTAEGLQAPLSTAFVNNGAIVSPSIRNEGSFHSIAISSENGLSFGFKASTMICAAVIVSRQTSDDKWLRSTAFLVSRDNTSIGSDLGSCLDAATRGTVIYSPSEQYLNNAGTSTAGTATEDDDDGPDEQPGDGD